MTGSRFTLLSLFGLFVWGSVALAQNSSTLNAPLNHHRTHNKWKSEYELFLGGNGFSEGKDEGFGALLYFKTRFEYRFAPWLRASVRPRLDLFAGRAQERYDNDTYQNRIRMLEGYLAVKPIQVFEVRAGAINQSYLDSPMLVSSHRGFPGFQEVLAFKTSKMKTELIAQQVLPTSYSLNTEREDKERLPYFLTQSLHFLARMDWFEIRAAGGHYTFRDMPNKVAFESGITGNRVLGEVAPGARFKNKFDGWFGSMELCACWDAPVQLLFEYQRIQNTAAPSVDADAQTIGFGPRFRFGDRELELRYRNYFIESDATVGLYNRSLLGNTNRMGDDIEIKLDFKDRKFALVGEWLNARPIRDNATQKTMTVYYFGVETPYAPF